MSKFSTMVLTMLKVGCIGFGGGSALIPVLQREAVQEKELISEEELNSGVVAASITPGALPVEIAAGIGKSTNGIFGMFAGASAMALPGAFLTVLLLLFTSLVGSKLTAQINYASIGITAYIIVILLHYLLQTLREAKNNRGGMIQAAIVILAVVIICTAGNFKSVWFAVSAALSILFLLAQGKSHIIHSPLITHLTIVAMVILVLIRLYMNFRNQTKSFDGTQIKKITLEILMWIAFLIVLCLPALFIIPRSFYFIADGLLSALMSFGGGDAYLSVAQGLFVDTGMIASEDFYGSVVTIANILPGSILCKVLSGIGYVWGLQKTGTVIGGIAVALAGFASATAASCAVFGVIKIIYDYWKKMDMFQAMSHLIRPIVSGLLISVGISLFNTNCKIEDNAGWGWGSVAFVMIVVGVLVYIMQKKNIHMIWQVLASLGISLLACNVYNLVY